MTAFISKALENFESMPWPVQLVLTLVCVVIFSGFYIWVTACLFSIGGNHTIENKKDKNE